MVSSYWNNAIIRVRTAASSQESGIYARGVI